MKKKATVLLMFILLGAAAFAQNESDFTINDEGTITAYKGWDTNIAIPAEIGGRQVRGIAENVFRSMDLTRVTFPDGIRSIGREAFANNKLAGVTIPAGVYVSTQAFANNQLVLVALGDRVSTGGRTFTGNRITTLIMGENVSVGDEAFEWNQLTSLNIKDNAVIGSSAFAYNNLLTNLTIGNNVTVSSNAFARNQITNLTIGNNVTVGSGAFNGNQLTSFSMGSGGFIADNAFRYFGSYNISAAVLGADIFFNAGAFGSYLYYAYHLNERKAGTYNTGGYTSKTEGDYTFIETRYGAVITGYRGSGGNRLIIPRELNRIAVKGIGNEAFEGKNISRMQLPDSLVFIGAGAFRENRLTEVDVPEGVTFIGYGAFSGNQLTNTPIGSYQRKFTEMVRIEPGTFQMGSPANEPGRSNNETQHQVRLTQGFYMGAYPVTQAQYQAVMGTNPSYRKGNFLPVEQVNWYDALVFCNRLSVMEGLTPAYSINNSTDPARWGSVPTSWNASSAWNTVTIVPGSTGYRLPTEAQWEYACRAGTTTAFNWGTNYIDSSKANYNASYVDTNNTTVGSYLGRTTEVGSYEPNAYGLYDMHGNVREWCQDWYGEYPSGAQTDPAGAVSGDNRVIRGGSWFNLGQNLRSAYRSSYDPYNPYSRSSNYGFRLVRP